MKTLIDCDIIEYCFSTAGERQKLLDEAAHSLYKPVYALPTFELCRALHLLAKLYGVAPNNFRACWADLSEVHHQNGEFFIHVQEHIMENPPRDILNLSHELKEEAPGGDPDRYWDHHHHLVERLRRLYPVETLKNGWMANPPEGRAISPIPRNVSGNEDLVIDTNNLLELLNVLPTDGVGINARELYFRSSSRLSSPVKRVFKNIIQSYGAAGHIIVPICVLEEADWVANESDNWIKYAPARAVLKSMSMNLEASLWNIFDFEPINQEILDHFIYLYESLYVKAVVRQKWQDFGDMLVITFGLYHGCKIASNEWSEGKNDVWDVVKTIFPYLVLN